MKILHLSLWLSLAWVQSLPGVAASLVSVADPQLPVPSTAGGQSGSARMTPDGRYVVFVSDAGNLTPHRHSQVTDVFLRDRATGTIQLISLSADGASGGNGDSDAPSISTNGQWIAFQSSAGNLLTNTTANSQIFLRDARSGAWQLISHNIAGGGGNGVSRLPVISADGRYVAFESEASDLVAGDTNRLTDVFVCEVASGAITLVSVNASGTGGGNGASALADLTPDGRYALFTSKSGDLMAAGTLTNGEVYVRDLQLGTTYWASAGAANFFPTNEPPQTVVAKNPAFDAAGRHVVYQAASAKKVLHLFADALAGSTVLISSNTYADVTAAGNVILWNASDRFSSPRISANGRYVAHVVPYQLSTNYASQVLLWDAATHQDAIVSVNHQGVRAANALSDRPVISPDGRRVAFVSQATDIVAEAASGLPQIFVRDMEAGATRLVSVNRSGAAAAASDFNSMELSADGSLALFESDGADFVDGDRNHAQDVFLRDLAAGVTECLSSRATNQPSLTGNGPSYASQRGLSADGKYFAFASLADNLAGGDDNGFPDIYWRDLPQGITRLASVSLWRTNSGNTASVDPAMSADGQRIAFVSGATDISTASASAQAKVFLREMANDACVLVSSNSADGTALANLDSALPWLSPNADKLLFINKTQSYFEDLESGVISKVVVGSLGSSFIPDTVLGLNNTLDLAILAGGTTVLLCDLTNVLANQRVPAIAVSLSPHHQWLAGVSSSVSATSSLVAIWDLAQRTNLTLTLTGSVSHPSISDDGRYLAFESTKLLPNNARAQIYRYDRDTDAYQLVSVGVDGVSGGNADSRGPLLSPDGRWVVFESDASNLVAGDANDALDVFARDSVSGVTYCLSLNKDGTGTGNGYSGGPALSQDGRTVVFASLASDLVAGDYNQASDVFIAPLPTLAAPRLLSVGWAPNGGLTIRWTAQPGGVYRLQYLSNLTDAQWTDLPGDFTATGETLETTDLPGATVAQRFYRIRLVP
jgi:Tol biopolymer transport system component